MFSARWQLSARLARPGEVSLLISAQALDLGGKNRSATGWIAISEQMKAFYCRGYRWLDSYRPVARIGASIRLYKIPGRSAESGSSGASGAPGNFNWEVPQPCSLSAQGGDPLGQRAAIGPAARFPDEPALSRGSAHCSTSI